MSINIIQNIRMLELTEELNFENRYVAIFPGTKDIVLWSIRFYNQALEKDTYEKISWC